MYCSKCGNEVSEGTNFCPHCGTSLNDKFINLETNNKSYNDGNLLSILAIVFSVVMPLVGLIIALVCKNQYQDPDTQSKFKIALTISSILIGIYAVIVIIGIVMFTVSAATGYALFLGM